MNLALYALVNNRIHRILKYVNQKIVIMIIIVIIIIFIAIMGVDTTIKVITSIVALSLLGCIIHMRKFTSGENGTTGLENDRYENISNAHTSQYSTRITCFSSANKCIEFNKPLSYTSYKKCGLSYKSYTIKAKFTATKRIRKLTQEYHNSYTCEQIKNLLEQEGYSEPFEISINEEYNIPTKRQIEYASDLNIPIHSELGKYDISCLIDRVLDCSGEPNPGLIEFADDEKLMFSYCIGKKQLYDLVFYQLDDKKTIAFFVFSIYRFLYNDREANLNKSPYKNVFFSFANKYICDKKFLKSMYDNYEGRNLRYFGTVNITNANGQIMQIYGGSNRTYCYQEAKKYLIQCFGNVP